MSVSDNKHFVQNGAVVDEALQHAGRVDFSQTPCTEDQRHLHRQHAKYCLCTNTTAQMQGDPLTSWERDPWATLVLQTGVDRKVNLRMGIQ